MKLGKRSIAGICLNRVEEPEFECRDIDAVPDDFSLFSEVWINFIRKISEYYVAPLGATLYGVISRKVLSGAQPASLINSNVSVPYDVTLSGEQQLIADAVPLEGYSAHLIEGVTGSGKTEIYLELIRRVIARGRKVIYLVPEISLTPQLITRFHERLGFMPALFHSRLTDKRHNEAFWSFSRGDQPLLLGARSALFVPTDRLGLIIVDEEHETTFKQEGLPSYHLRDMAVLYAKMNGIPVVMGSATPQAESIENCRSGKYKIHYLRFRHGQAKMPDIRFVDLKQSQTVGGVMAEEVYDKLFSTIRSGQQAIIFLNRKGYATSLFCRRCGKLQECPNCSVALTMYLATGRATCNYCGSEYRKLTCSECGCEDIIETGTGTEKVEEFLQQMFPGNVVRIDADVSSSYKKLSHNLELFRDRQAQILVGTQLIAKGLHFPEVTFVGILGLDNILSIPDFRAEEKAYQLVTQVSGRAGRGRSEGEVLIQSNMPEHQLFQFFGKEPGLFYDYELERRRRYEYPPYIKMARAVFSYSKKDEICQVSDDILRALRAESAGMNILGPAPAVIHKIKNAYRYSVIVKSPSHIRLTNLLIKMKELFERKKKGAMSLKIDRDPYFFM